MFMLLRSCQLDCIFMQFMFKYVSLHISIMPSTILFGFSNCKCNNTCISFSGEGGIFVCLSPREKNTTEMILADLQWHIPDQMDSCYKISVYRAHRVWFSIGNILVVVCSLPFEVFGYHTWIQAYPQPYENNRGYGQRTKNWLSTMY